MNIFDWVNNMTDQAQIALNSVIVLIGVGIAVIASVRGKGRIPSIIVGILAGGLFSWGCISGVGWMKDQTQGTIESAGYSTSIVETATVYAAEV